MERIARVLGADVESSSLSTKQSWVFAASLVLLAAIASQDAKVSLALRLAFGRFVYSTSNAGVLLVLLSMTAAISILAWTRQSSSRRLVMRSVYRRNLLGSILLGHAVHATALVAWAQQTGVASRARTYGWAGGEQTFMTLTHSHLGKTGLSRLTHSIGFSDLLQDYDMASPLLPFMTPIISFVIVFAFVFALASLLLGLPALRASNGRDPWRTLAYLFSGLSCIQLIIDGGPLALRLGPSLIVLLTVILARANESWAATAKRLRVPVLAFLFLHSTAWATLSGQSWAFVVVSLTPQIAGYTFMFCMSHLWNQSRETGGSLNSTSTPSAHRLRYVASAIATFLLFSGGIARDINTEIQPLFTPLASSDRVYEIDLRSGELNDVSEPLLGMSPFAVYNKAGDPLKPRDILISRNTETRSQGPGHFAILNADFPATGLPLEGGQAFSIEDIYPMRLGLRGWILRVDPAHPDLPRIGGSGGTVIDRNNRYVWLRILDASLRKAKISKYVMVPMEKGAEGAMPPIEKTRRSNRKRHKGAASATEQSHTQSIRRRNTSLAHE